MTNDKNNEDLKVVSTGFMMKILEKINEGHKSRDISIDRMSESIDKLSEAIKTCIADNEIYPTRQDILNHIDKFKEELMEQEKGMLPKFIIDLTGKNGSLTKLIDYIKKALWIIGIFGTCTAIILQILKYIKG